MTAALEMEHRAYDLSQLSADERMVLALIGAGYYLCVHRSLEKTAQLQLPPRLTLPELGFNRSLSPIAVEWRVAERVTLLPFIEVLPMYTRQSQRGWSAQGLDGNAWSFYGLVQ